MRSCVSDRFHLGEIVYPLLKKDGRKPLERWQQRQIERALMSSGAIIIYADASIDFKTRTFKTRGESFITIDEMPEEASLFQKALHTSILPIISSYGDLGPYERLGDVGRKIIDMVLPMVEGIRIANRMQAAGCIRKHPYMIVGERYSDGAYVEDQAGYKALCGDRNASTYLHRALDLCNDDIIRSVYLTNLWKHKNDAANEEDFLEEIKFFKPLSIVALGKKVDARLTSMGIDHTAIDHPQHAARFFFKKIDDYADRLQKAILNGIGKR